MTDIENLALLSKGAVLHAVDGATCHSSIDKLLRFDELLFSDPDEVTQEAGGEGRLMKPARHAAGWTGDSDASIYFQPGSKTVIVVKLGEESVLSRVGFMDTPWDRNYGRSFHCYVSLTGTDDDWIDYGQCEIEDIYVDGGDNSRYPLRNIWLQWDVARGDPPPALYVKYEWPEANGKRIHHLFAFGSPASVQCLTVYIAEEQGSSRISVTNLGGKEVAVLHPVDLEVTTLQDLRTRLAEAMEFRASAVKLVTESGRFLDPSSDQSLLAELFADT